MISRKRRSHFVLLSKLFHLSLIYRQKDLEACLAAAVGSGFLLFLALLRRTGATSYPMISRKRRSHFVLLSKLFHLSLIYRQKDLEACLAAAVGSGFLLFLALLRRTGATSYISYIGIAIKILCNSRNDKIGR